MDGVVGKSTRKVAIVTGAASGIGRATAEALCDAGVSTYLVDINAEAGISLAQELTARGSSALFRGGSVVDQDFLDLVVAEATAETGRVDYLINSAGVLDGYAPLHEASPELLDRVLAINLFGPMWLSQRVLPHMIDAGYGKIVNVASVAAFVGDGGGVSYTVSKHGLLGLTRSMAASYGQHGVRVNAVAPGAIATDLRDNTARQLDDYNLDMSRGIGSSSEDRLKSIIPLGTTGRAGDVAGLISFICSAAGDYFNGATLTLDGGLSCRVA